MRKNFYFLFFVLIVIFAFAISGCFYVKPIPERTYTNVSIIGKALIDEPITSATVRFFDLDGKLLKEVEDETYKTGAFAVFFDRIPDSFTIEVTGGIYKGKPFSGHLYAEVRDLDPEFNNLIVSPISTLIHEYMASRPNISYESATDLIKSFLMIPKWVNIVDYYEYNGQHFSGREFAAELEMHEDFDIFIHNLLEELESSSYHYFGDEEEVGSIATSVLKFALEKIAAGLISWGAGEGADWILNLIIGGDGGDDTKAAIEQMSAQLSQIINALQNLSNQVKEAETRIVSEIRKNKWEADMNSIEDQLSLIDTMYGRLKGLADSDPNKVKDAAAALAESILDPSSGIEPAFRAINMKFIDLWNTDGLLKVWAGNVYEQMAKQYGQYLTEELYVDDIMPFYEQLEDFYSFIASYQIQAVNLLIEANNSNDGTLAEYFYNIYQAASRGEQADIFREASEYFIGWVDFFCNWGPSVTVDPEDNANFTRIVQRCEEVIGSLGNYDSLLVIRLMWLSNYNGTNSNKIKPYFNILRDTGLTFNLERDYGEEWSLITVEASESVQHLTDLFYTFDDGSTQEAAHGFRTYVFTDPATGTYVHNNDTIYGPVIIPHEYLEGTSFGDSPINDNYCALKYAYDVDQDPNGNKQYVTWIVFAYVNSEFF
jgi:hypothetical protein